MLGMIVTHIKPDIMIEYIPTQICLILENSNQSGFNKRISVQLIRLLQHVQCAILIIVHTRAVKCSLSSVLTETWTHCCMKMMLDQKSLYKDVKLTSLR